MKLSTITLAIIILISGTVVSQNSQNDSLKKEKFTPSFSTGGRIMYDFNRIDSYEEKNSFTGSEFRRARLEMSGEVSENIGFQFQADFANAVIRFKALYIYFDNIPKIGGRLSVGNIHEPFSLDLLTSSKYITFIERASATDFILKWRTGFLYENFNLFHGKVGLQLAYTANNTNAGLVDVKLEDGRNISGRVSGLVIDNKEKKQLLHLGLSYSHGTPIRINENETRQFIIAVKPEAHMANVSLFNVFDDVKNVQIAAVEAAYNWGRFSVQGEFVHGNVATHLGNFSVPSYYGYISYFITGEHRPYKHNENLFGRVSPIKEFNFKDNWGAVELAARYSSFDLTDADKGKMENITLGVNWYLNSRTRIMYNYILSDNHGPENTDIHLLRFQIDFGKTFK